MRKTAQRKSSSYGEDSVQVHEGLAGVRLNPTMYLEALGNPMILRMLKEVVDNTYDEYAAGRNSGCEVLFDLKTNTYTVADYAQGIPVGLKQTKHEGKVSTLTLIFTKLHAGGKFDDKAYKTSSGTHGVGVSAVNAVSKVLRVWTHREKAWYFQEFKQGVPVAKLKKLGTKVPKAIADMPLSEKTKTKYGTIVQFVPDQTVVSEDASRNAKRKVPENKLTIAKLDHKIAGNWLRDLAMLNPGFKIKFTYVGKGTKTFINSKGLDWFVMNRCEENDLGAVTKKPFVYEDGDLKFAITWTDAVDDEFFTSYVNSSPTSEHGTHVDGFRAALQKAIKPHLTKNDKGFTIRDLLIGACGVLNWNMNSAQYSSQVKNKLESKVGGDVQSKLEDALTTWFQNNSRVAKSIIKKAVTANKARESLKQVMRSMTDIRKGSRTKMPKQLVQAPFCKPHERELYIVEGDSAGGTAKDARNNNQEILKMKGKINNSIKTGLEKLLAAEMVQNIIISMGVDPGSLDLKSDNPTFSVDKLRCNHVYMLADPDPDGAHINVLQLSFFYRLMPEFIKQGRLFVVDAKLYNAIWKGKLYKGDTFQEVAEQLPDTKEARNQIIRVKGWGEIGPELMDLIAFNPDTRVVRNITYSETSERIQYFRHIVSESAQEKRKLLGLKNV
jgi:DNA gyrase subunit B